MSLWAIILLLFASWAVVRTESDFYDLLGVSRSASTKEIRVAFKKLVVRLHPDKNKDDPKAHDKFVEITRAYEVLKDEDLRRRYDIHGEEGVRDDQPSPTYQSWQFYREQFGIYDDDREIITLSGSDFSNSVANSDDLWFINFYSPRCSHCHELAPVWREVARELEGVVRIGAINCMDEQHLCNQQGIQAYPSLIFYPQHEKYRGERTKEWLIQFVLDRSPTSAFKLTTENFAAMKVHHLKPWLVTICGLKRDCLLPSTVQKLALMLSGLVAVGSIDCDESQQLCSRLKHLRSGGTLFLHSGLSLLENGSTVHKPFVIKPLEAQRIGKIVLKTLLRPVEEMSADQVEHLIHHGGRKPQDPAHLLMFYTQNVEDLELRKLPATLKQISVKAGQVNCNQYREFCNSLHLTSFPKFALFKESGVEFYYGRATSNDLGNFVRVSVDNPLISLDPSYFPKKIETSDHPWFVEFFSPFCPFCLEQMASVKALAARLDHQIRVGTLDCSVHRMLCRNYNIRQYPTTIFFNKTDAHLYFGPASPEAMERFIDNILTSRVIPLTPDNFEEMVGQENTVWAIDFYIPHCSPCQKLQPVWRRVAKSLEEQETLRIANLDCTAYRQFCHSLGAHSFPTIRYYTSVRKYVEYPNMFRDHTSLLRWILDHLPSPVRRISPRFFHSIIDQSPAVWIVDFYVPWCGHCFQLAPEFEELARRHPQLRFGKVNCEEYAALCKHQDIHYYPAVMVYPFRRYLDAMTVDELDNQLVALLEKRTTEQATTEHTEL